jgi:hypothetical protein
MRSSDKSLTLTEKRRELTLIKKEEPTLIKQDATTVKKSLDHIEKQQQKEHTRRKNHYIDHHQFDTQTKKLPPINQKHKSSKQQQPCKAATPPIPKYQLENTPSLTIKNSTLLTTPTFLNNKNQENPYPNQQQASLAIIGFTFFQQPSSPSTRFPTLPFPLTQPLPLFFSFLSSYTTTSSIIFIS